MLLKGKLFRTNKKLKNYIIQLLKKFKKRKVHLSFIDKIWGADPPDIYLISEFKKGFQFLLCVIDIYSKYALLDSLKGKKVIAITNTFQTILDESSRKQIKYG